MLKLKNCIDLDRNCQGQIEALFYISSEKIPRKISNFNFN